MRLCKNALDRKKLCIDVNTLKTVCFALPIIFYITSSRISLFFLAHFCIVPLFVLRLDFYLAVALKSDTCAKFELCISNATKGVVYSKLTLFFAILLAKLKLKYIFYKERLYT